MTNKERLKKTISNDFSKEENYNSIIKKIEGKHMKNNVWRLSLVPICLIALIVGILFANSKNNNITFDHHIDEGNDIKLNINNLDKVDTTKSDADIIETKGISSDGLYIPWPEILKDGITIPKDLDKFNAYSIYTKKEGSSEYDILNCYVYNYSSKNDDNHKNLRIAFSKTNKPIRDYSFPDEGSNVTTLNNAKLTIFKYNSIYFVEFKYKGYNFDIETNNISQNELIDLLKSIIK